MLKSSFYLLKVYSALILSISIANLVVTGLHLAHSLQITTGLLFVVLTGLVNILSSLYSKREILVRNLLKNTLLEILVVPQIYRIWTRERELYITHKDTEDILTKTKKLFLAAIGMSILAYCSFVFLSYYYFHALPYLPYTKYSLSIHHTLQIGNFVRKVLVHNIILIGNIILGGFTGMLLTVRVLYVNGLSIATMTSLVLSGQENTVLPQGLLELSAVAISTGASALVFSLLWASLIWKYDSKDTYVNLLNRLLVRIAISVSVSVILLLIAANVEYSNLLYLLGRTSKPSGWYTMVYTADGFFIVATFLTLIDIFCFERLYAPAVFNRFFFPFLFTFTVLNVPTATPDLSTKLVIYGSFLISSYVLSRQVIEATITFLLRPRKVPSSDVELKIVEGISMNPVIFEGDVVIISKDIPSKLRPGMILDVRIPLRYLSKARNFIHELVWNEGGLIRTKGYNVKHPDPKIPARNVEGVALAVLRRADGGFQIEPLSDIPFEVTLEVLNIAKKLLHRYHSVKSKSKFFGLYLPMIITAFLSIIFLILTQMQA